MIYLLLVLAFYLIIGISLYFFHIRMVKQMIKKVRKADETVAALLVEHLSKDEDQFFGVFLFAWPFFLWSLFFCKPISDSEFKDRLLKHFEKNKD